MLWKVIDVRAVPVARRCVVKQRAAEWQAITDDDVANITAPSHWNSTNPSFARDVVMASSCKRHSDISFTSTARLELSSCNPPPPATKPPATKPPLQQNPPKRGGCYEGFSAQGGGGVVSSQGLSVPRSSLIHKFYINRWLGMTDSPRPPQ